MAKNLSKSGIASLQIVRPWHVTQSIDAFTGIEAYDISLSGSFTTTGSLIIKGTSTFTNGPITASVPIGIGSHVLASGTNAFAQGTGSNATGDFSFSQGRNTIASGFAAHAEGLGSQAKGAYAHAEGRNTIASGSYSHTQGRETTASGDYSHASGYGTRAFGNYQLVAGQFNITNTDNSSFIIGDGTDTNNRSNILFAGNNKIELNSPVTASSNISASGNLIGNNLVIGGGTFTSASLAAGGGGGGSTFPFTGDAQITGSLLVTGSNFISGTLHLMHPEVATPVIKVVDNSFLFYFLDVYYVGNTNNDLYFTGKSHIFANGAITASVDISSSANVIANTGSFSHLQGNSPITVGDQVTFQQPITASSDITASGNLYANRIFAAGYISTPLLTNPSTPIEVNQHLSGSSTVTASFGHGSFGTITTGNISSSGNLTALDLNLFGGDIDLKNAGAQSNIKFYCESSNAHHTKLQAAAHSDYSGDVTTTLPAYNFDFKTPNFQANVTASSFGGDGSALTNLQRPISNSISISFTASNANSGFYFRAGGNVTCSLKVNATASCNVGNEFEIFQTSSAGYVLIEADPGVTLNSKGGNTKLAGQFSGATLKKVGTDEWDLIGDLG
jgi:hypothetical protein